MYTYTLMLLNPRVFHPSDLGQTCVLESGNRGCKSPNGETTLELICSPLIVSFTAKDRLFFNTEKKVVLVIRIDYKAVT